MTWPASLPLPDWLPVWAALCLLAPVVLYLVLFLCIPFSVFGVKGRLDLIEARLDELQGEIRGLALRLPPSAAERAAWDGGAFERRTFDDAPRAGPAADRPPIPPAPTRVTAPDPLRAPPRTNAQLRRATGGRAEPRLEWPGPTGSVRGPDDA